MLLLFSSSSSPSLLLSSLQNKNTSMTRLLLHRCSSSSSSGSGKKYLQQHQQLLYLQLSGANQQQQQVFVGVSLQNRFFSTTTTKTTTSSHVQKINNHKVYSSIVSQNHSFPTFTIANPCGSNNNNNNNNNNKSSYSSMSGGLRQQRQRQLLLGQQNFQNQQQKSCIIRYFQTESDYHLVADETLEDIQDAIESALEDEGITENFEVTYASGVLTMSLPPHGTWVLNKQTPNRQIWWSSPISGPRRYEYETETNEWVFTRDESHSITLTQTLKEEMQQIYNIDIEL